MTMLDDAALTEALRELAEALVPEAALDVPVADEPLLQLVGATHSHRSRNPRMLLVASLTVAATVLVAVVVAHYTTNDSTTSSAGQVGRYFAPSSLPDGWTLLDFTETAPDTVSRLPESLYERTNPPAKVWLSATPTGTRPRNPTDSSMTPFDPPLDGHWSQFLARVIEDPTTFELSVDGRVVTGQAVGLKIGELQQLLALADVNDHGLPVLADTVSFTLVAQSATTEHIAATYKATYGKPGTSPNQPGFLFLTGSRLEQPHDPRLNAGVTATTQKADGREIFDSLITQASWYPEPDLRVEISGSGYPAEGPQNFVDIAAGLQEIDTTQLDRQIAAVPAMTGDIAVAATAQFGDATASLFGSRLDPSSLCLSMPAGQRCSLAIGSEATYRSGIAQLKESFLIDGSWFVVGFDSIEKSATITSDLGIPTIETAEDDHGRTWILARMPAEATTATWGTPDEFGSLPRPTR
jgi:hypothetical protein